MATVLMTDPATGRVALYDEAPGGGNPADPNSLRNRPLNNPTDWLPNIYFHSDFNYLEVAAEGSQSVSHPLVGSGSGASANEGSAGQNVAFSVGQNTATHAILNHNLGYVPRFKVAHNGQMICPGFPVQSDAVGGARFVTGYATTTQIRIFEFANAGSSNLAAVSRTYQALAFADLPAPSGNRLIDWNPVSGVLTLAFGRWRSDRKYLQVVPGGSPFAMVQGRNIDLANGAARVVTPNGTALSSVPSSLRLTIQSGVASPIYGNPMNYTGSFPGAPSIQVQAP